MFAMNETKKRKTKQIKRKNERDRERWLTAHVNTHTSAKKKINWIQKFTYTIFSKRGKNEINNTSSTDL
jgi:phosphopantetheinyl transferase